MPDEAPEKAADDTPSKAPSVGETDASETDASAPPPSAAAESADAKASATSPADSESKPKKKKKRKKAPEEPTTPAAEPLDATGRERPQFVLGFPQEPALNELVRAFELGNYAYVREHAPELAEKTKDERVRSAALELTRRIEPDPLVKVLLALSLTLLVALVIWAYKTHGN